MSNYETIAHDPEFVREVRQINRNIAWAGPHHYWRIQKAREDLLYVSEDWIQQEKRQRVTELRVLAAKVGRLRRGG